MLENEIKMSLQNRKYGKLECKIFGRKLTKILNLLALKNTKYYVLRFVSSVFVFLFLVHVLKLSLHEIF